MRIFWSVLSCSHMAPFYHHRVTNLGYKFSAPENRLRYGLLRSFHRLCRRDARYSLKYIGIV